MSPRAANPIDESAYSGRVAALVRARRLALGMTVAEAAARAKHPAITWYTWEHGGFSVDAIPAIAKALRCRPADLLPSR